MGFAIAAIIAGTAIFVGVNADPVSDGQGLDIAANLGDCA
jgi:hypothetical protein